MNGAAPFLASLTALISENLYVTPRPTPPYTPRPTYPPSQPHPPHPQTRPPVTSTPTIRCTLPLSSRCCRDRVVRGLTCSAAHTAVRLFQRLQAKRPCVFEGYV